MTLEQIKSMLRATGFPVAYHSFKTKQTVPYICFLLPYDNIVYADDTVHHTIKHLQIELYTAEKNPQAEEKLQQVLQDAGLVWDRSETYIQTEKIFQIIYETEV